MTKGLLGLSGALIGSYIILKGGMFIVVALTIIITLGLSTD